MAHWLINPTLRIEKARHWLRSPSARRVITIVQLIKETDRLANQKDRLMPYLLDPVGLEPTQLALPDLKTGSLDHSDIDPKSSDQKIAYMICQLILYAKRLIIG